MSIFNVCLPKNVFLKIFSFFFCMFYPPSLHLTDTRNSEKAILESTCKSDIDLIGIQSDGWMWRKEKRKMDSMETETVLRWSFEYKGCDFEWDFWGIVKYFVFILKVVMVSIYIFPQSKSINAINKGILNNFLKNSSQ